MNRKLSSLLLLAGLILVIAFATACGVLAPTPTPPPTPVACLQDERKIVERVHAMQQAVLANDRESYLRYVDLSEAIFALEHTRWVDAWAKEHNLVEYQVTVERINLQNNEATADFTVTWRTTANLDKRTAVFPVRFVCGKDGEWRYAGELWVTSETTYFRVRAAPGLGSVAQAVLAMLPDIYKHVTMNLEYEPRNVEIKIYSSRDALLANTKLSLPNIGGWNEPGESLKLIGIVGESPPRISLAHEIVHFIEFEMAGGKYSQMPWWLEEGIAEYVAWGLDETQGKPILTRTRAYVATEALVPWEKMRAWSTTPPELWQYAYMQGYSLVLYVSERFGDSQRNAWMRAMAKDMDLSQATLAILGISFEQLDIDFRAWLKKP